MNNSEKINLNRLSHLEASQNADSIYYADLFKICGKVWMITGCGKSKAARIAINYDNDADIARDSVAMIRYDKVLYGYHDLGAVDKDLSKRESLHKIDFIAHCLTEEQTANIYSNKPSIIMKIDNKLLATLLYYSRYPAVFSRDFFNEEQYKWLINPERRFNRFIELTNDIISAQFLIIPWMTSIEEKASLYTTFNPCLSLDILSNIL